MFSILLLTQNDKPRPLILNSNNSSPLKFKFFQVNLSSLVKLSLGSLQFLGFRMSILTSEKELKVKSSTWEDPTYMFLRDRVKNWSSVDLLQVAFPSCQSVHMYISSRRCTKSWTEVEKRVFTIFSLVSLAFFVNVNKKRIIWNNILKTLKRFITHRTRCPFSQ